MYHTSFLNQRTGPSPGKPNLDPWSSGNCPGCTLNPQGNLECPGPQPPPEQLRWVSSTNILQRSSHTAMAELNLLSADVVSTLHCSSSQEPDEGHGIQPGLHSLCRYSYRLLPLLSPCRWTHGSRDGLLLGCIHVPTHVPHKPQRRRLLAWASLCVWGAKANCCSFPITPTTSAPLWEERHLCTPARRGERGRVLLPLPLS